MDEPLGRLHLRVSNELSNDTAFLGEQQSDDTLKLVFNLLHDIPSLLEVQTSYWKTVKLQASQLLELDLQFVDDVDF